MTTGTSGAGASASGLGICESGRHGAGCARFARSAQEKSRLRRRAAAQALLAARADPNARLDEEGPGVAADKSLLMMVAADPDKVALLLEHGADVAASGVEAYIEQELATEDPDGYAPYRDGLRASKRVIAAARRQ